MHWEILNNLKHERTMMKPLVYITHTMKWSNKTFKMNSWLITTIQQISWYPPKRKEYRIPPNATNRKQLNDNNNERMILNIRKWNRKALKVVYGRICFMCVLKYMCGSNEMVDLWFSLVNVVWVAVRSGQVVVISCQVSWVKSSRVKSRSCLSREPRLAKIIHISVCTQ